MNASESTLKSTAFAPVNIAWIKYMGKVEGKPANSSLSMTLNTLGTTTSMAVLTEGTHLKFIWNEKGYVPPQTGILKTEFFLRNESHWKQLLEKFGFELHLPQTHVLIHTQNNVPAATGIATSASAFAALTLAWSALLAGPRGQEWMDRFNSHDSEFRKAIAAVAAKGSGSACRSIDGPWVEWSPSDGIKCIDGGETKWIDFILLIESEPKAVSSSEAHQRVKTSPLFEGRVRRVENRLQDLKQLLVSKPQPTTQIRQLVLDEALDMHELFHTSAPSFRYMNSTSQEVVHTFQKHSADLDLGLPSLNSVITLDAGANVHLFVPAAEQDEWTFWLRQEFPKLPFLVDEAFQSKGARYESVSD
jgi:diphosphomevalonate decarboxylase